MPAKRKSLRVYDMIKITCMKPNDSRIYFVRVFIGLFHDCPGQSANMADLLGSILGSMEKPPSLGDAEKKKARGVIHI